MGKIWREIGALGPGIDIYQPESFYTVDYKGTTVSLYTDLDKLHKHLLEVSPEDKEEIDSLCDAIGKMSDAGIPMVPPDMMSPMDIIRLMKNMLPTMKISKKFSMSLADYVQRFKHPAIRMALTSVLPGSNSAFVLPFTLGTLCSGNGGRPAGGSLAMALRMTEKYKSLGGKLHLGKEVDKINIEAGKATAIILSDGTTVNADYVIPAADIHITLDRFLEGRYPNPQIAERDADTDKYPSPTCIYAAFGVDADLSSIPADYIFEATPFIYQDQERNIINFKHYCYEPSFAPEGKSVVIVYFDADYDWWKNKHSNLEEYRNEKNRISDALTNALEERFPDLKGKITPLDMATPVTYERYCGAWRGSWMSYGQTPGTKQTLLNGRIKGIDNLYMAGQWLMSPGGLPVAIITGRWAVQRICKNEKLTWRW